METLNKYIIYIGKVVHFLGSVSLAVIIICVTLGITFRLFGKPLFWVEELSTFMLVHLCYFSATSVTIQRRHIIADFFIAKTPEKIQKASRVAGNIIGFVFFLVVCISIFKLIPDLVFESPALGIPRRVYYFPVISMSAVMGFVLLVDILNTFLFKQEQGTLDEPQPRATMGQ